MQIGEAVVSGASQGPKGAQEVEFKAVCSMANCERLNVIAGEWRAAVTLDRPPRGALCQFKVTVRRICDFSWATTSSWSFSIQASRRESTLQACGVEFPFFHATQ
jgi:hypothetical protein